MLTILHGADFHLDSPFSGLSPQAAALRREEQRQLLFRLAELAQEVSADLLLLAGDLFDGARVYPETLQTLLRALEGMPCPVFIAPGNHDCYTAASPYADLAWPQQVHIFRTPEIEAIPLPHLGCTVYGAAFTSPRREDSPLSGFRARGEGLHLMVLHGQAESGGDYAPIPRQDMADSGLTYLALGHVHQTSGLRRAGDTLWAYPGCPEGRGFDETGEKGVLCLRLEESGKAHGEFLPLGRRRYEILTADLTGADSLLAAVERVLPPETQEHIFRVLLTGECPPGGLSLPGLYRALSGRCFGLELQDHTRAPRNVWDRMGEDTLTGLFLRELSRRMEGEPDNETLDLAVRYGLAALEGREDVSP